MKILRKVIGLALFVPFFLVACTGQPGQRPVQTSQNDDARAAQQSEDQVVGDLSLTKLEDCLKQAQAANTDPKACFDQASTGGAVNPDLIKALEDLIKAAQDCVDKAKADPNADVRACLKDSLGAIMEIKGCGKPGDKGKGPIAMKIHECKEKALADPNFDKEACIQDVLKAAKDAGLPVPSGMPSVGQGIPATP